MQRYKKFITYQISPSDRNIQRLSHLGFLVAIGFTAWFHELRSTFGESAMTLFNIINHPDLSSLSAWCNVNFFQNITTILAVKTNLSLTWISLIFSTSPMIFAYGIFGITEYGFKQKYSGIFLLLLLSGVNTSFFGAVHTAYSGLCLVYLIASFVFFILEKKGISLNADRKLSVFGLLALGLSVVLKRPSLEYFNAKWGEWCFSPLSYFSGIALNTYVIIGCVGLYLIIFLKAQNNVKTIKQIVFWSFCLLVFVVFWSKKNQFSFDYEILLLPLIAEVLLAVKIFILDPFSMTKLRFWTLFILVCLAIGGLLRTHTTFEKRESDVIQLIQAANTVSSEKIALSEDFQQIEKYIDPTFLAFETPMIAAFRNLPQKSICFIPKDKNRSDITNFQIADTVQNMRYFRFSDNIYTVLERPLMPRKLIADILYDFENVQHGTYNYRKIPNLPRIVFNNVYTQSQQVFSGNYSVFLGKENQYGVDLYLKKVLQRGDSVEISVWRKGSDDGHLIISDDKNPNVIWNREQTISEPDARGWQKLSFVFIHNQNKEPLKTYVMNTNYKKETIFFDDFRLQIWRE